MKRTQLLTSALLLAVSCSLFFVACQKEEIVKGESITSSIDLAEQSRIIAIRMTESLVQIENEGGEDALMLKINEMLQGNFELTDAAFAFEIDESDIDAGARNGDFCNYKADGNIPEAELEAGDKFCTKCPDIGKCAKQIRVVMWVNGAYKAVGKGSLNQADTKCTDCMAGPTLPQC